MGAVLIEVCGRCGTPNGEGREWVNNAFKTLHRCSDGVMGELAQVDPADPDNFPSLDPKYLEPDNHLRIVKKGKDGEHHYAMIVQCHKCAESVQGDYWKDEADKLRYNLFNCSRCGEWQEWMMHLVDGDPIPLKQWKPFDWSKVPTSKEESRRLIRSLVGKLIENKKISDKANATVALPATVVQSNAYPATFGPAAAIPVVGTPEPKLKEFSHDAIANAVHNSSCRPPYCACASCGRHMDVKVWGTGFRGHNRDLPMIILKDNSKVIVDVMYHCPFCFRDDVYVRAQTAPTKSDKNGRYMGATLHGAWYKYFGTFFKDKIWNPPANWRPPDAILTTTPIKAQGSDQTPVF